MHFVYVIFSQNTNKFYIGETPDVLTRLAFHNDIGKNTNSTKSGIPWEIFWFLEVGDRSLARRIETHLKKMKSKKYLEDLKKHPSISENLVEKYKGVPGSPR
ncbi:endonuclease [Sphingobacteriaceae bacterium]|nr:endonuclease [Sphingobacteriaceae bacterium]